MPTELDNARHLAWRTFLKAHAVLVCRIDAELTGAGLLPLDWYDVLLALDDAPDRRLRLNELARAVLLSRSGLTRLVDRLEAAGLLCREACATDRRGAFAVLTEEGSAALRRTWPAYSRGIAEHFARHVTVQEAEILTGAMTRALEAAQPPE